MSNEPEIGDVILAEWPGDGLREFAISHIRKDENGIMCVVFGEGSIVGAEALKDLTLVGDRWEVK